MTHVKKEVIPVKPNKILFCATMDIHFKAFHLPQMEWFRQHNWEVHTAANGVMDLPFVNKSYNIPIQRSPLRMDNLKAYRKLRSIIENNQYDIIHCHTPLGGVLGRLAARKARKNGTKVIYTAHGFHFCEGTPLMNWLIYYPIEKGLARLTDCLITINEEDYAMAVRNKFSAKRIERVHGVGVNTERYKPANILGQIDLRSQYGYESNDFLMFYAAEFNRNKNHKLLIHALALMKEEAISTKLLLAGVGPLLEECRQLAFQLEVENMVQFLGYRDDIAQILPMCDVAVSSSIREGLPVNIMEAMACALPIVATRNRGHKELIEDQVNGFVVHPDNVYMFAERLLKLKRSKDLRQAMGLENLRRVRSYSLTEVGQELRDIYLLMGNKGGIA